MPVTSSFTLLAATLLLAAAVTAASAETQRPGSRVYLLHALHGSGEIGTIALKPRGARTDVEIHLVNAPKGTEQPAHIHKGTCAKLDPAPAYPLDSVLDGTSDGVVNVATATLLASPMAVNVHRSTNDLKVQVACANLTP